MKGSAFAAFLSSFLLVALPNLASATNGFYAAVTPLTEPTPLAGSGFAYGNTNGAVLSTDGSTVLVGAAFEALGSVSEAGRAYFYHANAGVWPPPQEVDDPDDTANDEFGATFALSGGGTVALIGSSAAVGGHTSAGKVYVYTLSGSTWSQSHEFDDPTPTANDSFGSAVALSSDGTVAVIGASGTNGNQGEFYIYIESSGVWSQVAAITDPDASANDVFGIRVAMSQDGTAALVGSEAAVNGHVSAGKAYLYTSGGSAWGLSQEFDDPAAAGDDFFGAGLAVFTGGDIVVIGASGADSNAGAAYIYINGSSTWPQPEATIKDPDGAANDYFGSRVGISADGVTVIISSAAAVAGQIGAGKAYLYTDDREIWSKSYEFDDPTPASHDYFGSSGVAFSGDVRTIYIAASGTKVGSHAGAGEGYIYQAFLFMGLSVSATTLNVDQTSVFTVDVANEDLALDASNVTLTFSAPTGLVADVENADSGDCTPSGSTVTCTLANLRAGTFWRPAIGMTPAVAGSFNVTATLTGNSVPLSTPDNTISTTITSTASSSGGGGSGSSSSGGGGGIVDLLTLSFLSLLLAFTRKRLHT